eukprot:8778196-Karenia_brevis.AAC.1
MTIHSGSIVSNEKQLAGIVFFVQKRCQHISAKYAENYCQSQHMNKNSSSIVSNEALPAMVVVMHQKRNKHINA